MSSSNDTAPPSVSDGALGHSAQEIGALARERAGAIERERRLPDDLVGRLRASGMMRAGAPRALGAAQAPPTVTLGCAETVARGDASAGWCVSIAATSSLLSAYLPADGAREVFGDADAVAAGVWAPRGIARPVDGALVGQVAAVGTRAEIVDRVAAYHAAGADHVAAVPATAEDGAGRAVLAALSKERGEPGKSD